MSVPLRLLGLLLTAAGLVVATTGLVLLVHPLDSGGQATRSVDEAGDAAPEPDAQAAAARSPLPVAASPGVTPSPPPPPSPPRATDSEAGDRDGATAPDLGARSPTVSTVSHPAGPRPASEVPAPSRPQSETPDPGPPSSPRPAPSSPPPDTGVAPADPESDEVQGAETSCRHAWPWSGRRGSRGRGDGWGPPLPCDSRSVGAGARGPRPPGAR